MHELRINFSIISYKIWKCGRNCSGGKSTLFLNQSCVVKLSIFRAYTWQSEKGLSSPLENPKEFSPQEISDVSYGHHIRGVELTCTASQLQRDIIASLLWYSDQGLGNFTNFMLALYHSAAIDISHMFC